jgi:hypothetical protein
LLRTAGLAVLALFAATSLGTSGEQGPPLTDEDVVVAFISGTPVPEIIAKIRASNVAFDLGDEMLGEMRAAGLPRELIQAMVERQRELTAAQAPVQESDDSAAETGATPRLQIVLNPDFEPKQDQPRPVLRLHDQIDPQTYEYLRLRGDVSQFTDMALAVLCTTQDHVPDHWRSKSALGRDFVGTPRHKLLAFLPGAERKEAGKLAQVATKLMVSPGHREAVATPGVLGLELPPTIEFELEPEIVHDLTLGLAVQAADRYYLVAADSWEELVVPATGLTIQAEIRAGKDDTIGAFEVRFLPPGEMTQ